ncbi:MAG: hypothetical protein ACFFED_03020 [Candidatus Thorarchaeota archaeon]
MKNIWNCISCLGILLLIVGAGMAALFTVAYFYILNVLGQTFDDGGAQVFSLITTGVIIAIIGAVFTTYQFSKARKWNNLVRFAKMKGEITMQEAAEHVGVTPEKAKAIIYEAVGEGELTGTIAGDTFTRGQPAVITRVSETQKVLIVCPYCGAKNEQGMPRCHNCNNAL